MASPPGALRSVSPSTGRAISGIRGLEELTVYGSKSFDDDAAWISQINSLRRLDHLGDNVTSSGIAKLADLHHLESLALPGDGVNGDAIKSLVQMKALKTLHCNHISPGGKKRLETERPDLKVTFGFCY
jgi:hypothetical protein